MPEGGKSKCQITKRKLSRTQTGRRSKAIQGSFFPAIFPAALAVFFSNSEHGGLAVSEVSIGTVSQSPPA